jgi:hypothetical protein
MKVERFEDIKAWQEARSLVKLVYAAVKDNVGFRRDFPLSQPSSSSGRFVYGQYF